MKTLPIVDMSGMYSGDAADAQAVAARVHQACTEVGFFYVTGHGVAQDVIDDALGTMQQFFLLPVEEKRRCAVNANHRGFHQIGGAVMPNASHPDYFATALDK
jgi:isopenicillin N synthase-like dioxygenase